MQYSIDQFITSFIANFFYFVQYLLLKDDNIYGVFTASSPKGAIAIREGITQEKVHLVTQKLWNWGLLKTAVPSSLESLDIIFQGKDGLKHLVLRETLGQRLCWNGLQAGQERLLPEEECDIFVAANVWFSPYLFCLAKRKLEISWVDLEHSNTFSTQSIKLVCIRKMKDSLTHVHVHVVCT